MTSDKEDQGLEAPGFDEDEDEIGVGLDGFCARRRDHDP
jgi:hypothetical protein